MMKVIIYPRPWVRYLHHVEQGCLHNLVVGIEISLKTRKGPFPRCIEKLSIITTGIKDDPAFLDEVSFFLVVIQEVGLHAEGDNLGDSTKPASKGYKGGTIRHVYSYKSILDRSSMLYTIKSRDKMTGKMS